VSVTKRVYADGRTVYRARLWVVPPHGPRRQLEKEFQSKRKAEAWEREQRQTAHGKNIDLERLTLAESGLWERAEPVLRARLAPKTLEYYRRGWRVRVIETLGGVKVGALSVGDVEWAQATWIAAGAKPSSVRQARHALSAVLTVAVNDGLLSSNPARIARRPPGRVGRRDGNTMTPKDLAALVGAIRSAAKPPLSFDRYALMVDLMGAAGLRYGEAAGLYVGDLDFSSQMIHVQRQVTEVPLDDAETVLPSGRWRDGNLVWGPPKSGKDRVVPMPRHLVGPLMAHTAGLAPTALVFESKHGKVTRSSVLKRAVAWPSLVARLGYPGFRLHDLRASAVTNYLDAGVPVHVVRDIAGHGDISVTDRYARRHTSALTQAADALARYCDGGEDGGEPTANRAAGQAQK